MNWAWRQTLAPTLKLVLMALADAADDQGVCWPSVSTLARKCSVSTHTVRRALRVLVDQGLLVAEPRRRPDGSSTSNRYRLHLGGGDNSSPGADAADAWDGQGCQGATDTGVTPVTTSGIHIDRPRPNADGRVGPSVDGIRCGGGEQGKDLEFPECLSGHERKVASSRLADIHPELAQQLLDELAARMKGGAVRVSPLVYLLGLIKRAHAGRFEPEAGWVIADARERRRRHEALGRAPPCASETLEAKAAPDNALVRRLEAIRARGRERGAVE